MLDCTYIEAQNRMWMRRNELGRRVRRRKTCGSGGCVGSIAFISIILGHWGFSPLAHLAQADSYDTLICTMLLTMLSSK